MEVDPVQRFVDAIRDGNLPLVEDMLAKGLVDPSALENTPLIAASETGKTPIVKRLLKEKSVDPTDQDNLAIRLASFNGHVSTVDALLDDQRANPVEALVEAIANDELSEDARLAVVARLLQDTRVNPGENGSIALRKASEKGDEEMVALLLQYDRVDPCAHDNEAIIKARKNGHDKVVRMLLNDQRTKWKSLPEKFQEKFDKRKEHYINFMNVRKMLMTKTDSGKKRNLQSFHETRIKDKVLFELGYNELCKDLREGQVSSVELETLLEMLYEATQGQFDVSFDLSSRTGRIDACEALRKALIHYLRPQ